MLFEEFQDGHHGCHLGCRNGTILAILNFHISPMLPTKFWLNQTYFLWANVVWTRWPSWISKWNYFSNSESLCCSDASHQVSAQSNLGFGRRCHLTNFKMAAYLRYQNRTILAILNLHVFQISPTKFWLNPTYHLGADVVWWFLGWPPWCPSWISEQTDFSNSESLCFSDASHQFSA